MSAPFVISLFCLLLGIYSIAGLYVYLWRSSDHKRYIYSGKAKEEFMGYMKRLRAEDAGRQVLRQFRSIQELKDANARLKKRYAKAEKDKSHL